MKKLATILTAAVMLLTTSAFASDGDNVTASVKAAFQSDFSGVNAVTWKKSNDFYFASFTLNNINVDAAYNEDGQLVGTSRQIELSQLPLSISVKLTKKYSGYNISPLVLELNYDGETSYYFTAENDRQVLKLKSNASGEINVESKRKK